MEPRTESQAIDRAQRIGQTRPVFDCRLITRGISQGHVLEHQKQ